MADQTAQVLSHNNILTADLVPCGDQLRPHFPKRPSTGPPIGLTLSGGGFRATFAALGVVRYLADIGMLGNVWISSSVSGGSVANGIIATNWGKLRDRGFSPDAVDELLIEPTVKQIDKASLKSLLIRNVWRAIGSKNRTDVLAWAFDKWFMGDATMDELDPAVRWVINGANMATGTRFTFERDIIGDYVNGYLPMDQVKVKVALAAATSAAVPGAFAPVTLKGVPFPCRGVDTVSLLDGGGYDNTGIEVLNSKQLDDVFTICLAAGGILKVGGYGKIPIINDLMRANSLLYRQSRALRTRDMVERFVDTERKGCVFKLNTSTESVLEQVGSDADAVTRVNDFVAAYPGVDTYKDQELAFVATSFDQFDQGLSRRLIHRGWWTTGLTMRAFHPDMPAPTGDAPQI